MHNPWTYLAEKHPAVAVVWTQLPRRVRGCTDGRTIWMDPRLTQVQRRVVVCHETIHIERGVVMGDRLEELRVDRLTADRLIAIDDLVDALRCHRYPTADVLAESLWVEPAVVRTRVDHLSGVDLAHIENQLDLDWGVA